MPTTLTFNGQEMLITSMEVTNNWGDSIQYTFQVTELQYLPRINITPDPDARVSYNVYAAPTSQARKPEVQRTEPEEDLGDTAFGILSGRSDHFVRPEPERDGDGDDDLLW